MAFITVAGEQLIAQKQGANEVLSITHFVLAYIDGLGPEPADRIEALPDPADIVDTRPVTWQGYVNANQVVYSLTLDSSIGDYSFNWVGLKAAGGQLVAATHIETQIKSKTAGAVPGNNLTRNFLLAYSGIQATTAIEVPAETWQIDFTDRVWEIDERQRLSNFDNYGPAAFFCDGFKVSHVAGNTYAVAAGVGYVGGIRCAHPEALTLSVAAPKAVWIDASLQGDINGVAAHWVVTATSAELADYTDALGFDHCVAKIAEIPSAGVVIDLRPKAPVFLRRDDIVPEAEARAGTATIPRAWTAQRVKQAVGNQVPDASETVKGKVELATAAETAAGTDNTRAVHPAGLKSVLNGKLGIGYLLVKDVKPSGTPGGSCVAGTQVRTLNTVEANTIEGAALAGNRMTLPAGTYRVDAVTTSFGSNQAKAMLYNVTAGTVQSYGMSCNGSLTGNTDPTQTNPRVKTRFTLAEPMQFELRMYCSQANAGNGLGDAIGQGSEVYSIVEIVQES